MRAQASQRGGRSDEKTTYYAAEDILYSIVSISKYTKMISLTGTFGQREPTIAELVVVVVEALQTASRVACRSDRVSSLRYSSPGEKAGIRLSIRRDLFCD